MNTIIVSGRLGRNPELKVTAEKGTAVCSFSIAEDYYDYRNKEKRAEWWKIVSYGPVAERADKALQKGMKITVVGEQRTRTYTDREGLERTITEVTMRDFDIHVWPDKKQGEGYHEEDWIPESAE